MLRIFCLEILSVPGFFTLLTLFVCLGLKMFFWILLRLADLRFSKCESLGS